MKRNIVDLFKYAEMPDKALCISKHYNTWKIVNHRLFFPPVHALNFDRHAAIASITYKLFLVLFFRIFTRRQNCPFQYWTWTHFWTKFKLADKPKKMLIELIKKRTQRNETLNNCHDLDWNFRDCTKSQKKKTNQTERVPMFKYISGVCVSVWNVSVIWAAAVCHKFVKTI